MRAQKDSLVLEVPSGMGNFSLTLSSATNFKVLSLKVAWAGGFQWVPLTTNNITFSITVPSPSGTAEVECSGDETSTFNCKVTETPVWFSLQNDGGEEAFVNAAFTYEAPQCSDLPVN